MKVTVLFLVCFMLILVTKCGSKSSTDFQKWEDFKIAYARNYDTPEEEQKRMNIFMRNLRKIRKHNKKFKKGEKSYEIGVNGFADKTLKEFKDGYSDLSCNCNNGITRILPKQVPNRPVPRIIVGDPPESKNWVTEGAVTRVKNQNVPRICGSCWAFAAAGLIESYNFIKNRNLVELSEQNLLDCTGGQWENGTYFPNDCTCGNEYFALNYVKYNRGIDTAQSYPYVAVKERCHFRTEYIGARIDNFQEIAHNETALMRIVGIFGPATASMRFEYDMSHIKKGSGIYSNPRCGMDEETSFNHVVLVVGYGVDKIGNRNVPYWLLKNSWGTDWADDGYLKILRNSDTCQISSNQNLYIP